jgi:hypothetical protein
MSDYVQGIILDERTASRGYLNHKFLEKMIYSHIRGERNYANEINKTVTAELIHRLLIENM